MSEHDITFTEDQALVIDKHIRDKEELQRQIDALNTNLVHTKDLLRHRTRQLDEAIEREKEAPLEGEEEIRASERERIATWLEKGGHEPDYLYQCTNATAAFQMSDWLPSVIRRAEHNHSYKDHRQACDEQWPKGYNMQEEDFEFDVNTRVWER